MPRIESRLAELERIKEQEVIEPMSPVELAHRIGYLFARLKDNPTEQEIELGAEIKKMLAEFKAQRCDKVGEGRPAEPAIVKVVSTCPDSVLPASPLAVSLPAVAPLSAPKPSANAEIIRQRIREMKRPKWTAKSA